MAYLYRYPHGSFLFLFISLSSLKADRMEVQPVAEFDSPF